MKRHLLIATAALIALGASALDITPVQSDKTVGTKANRLRQALTTETPARQKAPTADGFEIAFCDKMYSWFYAAQQNNVTYQCFTPIPEEIATALSGNKITEITFSASLTNAKQSRDGYVFVAEISEEGKLVMMAEQEVKVIDSYEASATADQTVAFDEPYVIKEGTAFVFGYTVKGCKYNALTQSMDYPIGVGTAPVNDFAGYVYLFEKNDEFMGGLNMQDVGYNLYLKANTVGEKKSIDNIFNIETAILGMYSLPILVNGEEVAATVLLSNLGSNDLTSITYTASMEGVEPVTATQEIAVAAGEDAAVKLALPAVDAGRNTVALSIDEINGVKLGYNVNLPYIKLDGEGYDRKFVVEEATGTWCGWCPRGIVGLEYMLEKYPDTITPIAVHGDDQMQVDSYVPWLDEWISGFPSAVINRDYIWAGIDPSAEELDWCYTNYWQSQRSPVKVDVKVDYDKEANTLEATATTEFALDEDNADYSLAFVLVQDNIPGAQTNYYAGGQYGECGGWEKKDKTVGWFYDHVARDIETTDGIAGSIPANITKGEQYTYNHSVPTANIYNIESEGTVVTNVDKTAVIALVIDETTGSILNAAQVNAADYGTVGIKDAIGTKAIVRAGKGTIEISGEYDRATVYNTVGARMAELSGNTVSLPAGIYMVRVDGKTHKVIVR